MCHNHSVYGTCNLSYIHLCLAQTVKSLPAVQETRVRSLVRKIPWRRKWRPTPVFLPGKSHGWRSLAGYSPWDHKESTRLSDFTFIFTCACLVFSILFLKLQAPTPLPCLTEFLTLLFYRGNRSCLDGTQQKVHSG